MIETWSDHADLPPMRRELHFTNRVVVCFEERPKTINAFLADAVRRRPDGEALVLEDRRVSFAALDAQVASVAGGLKARGVQPGDRVALLLSNSIEFVVLVYAVARLGAISVPLNVREQRPEITHVLLDCKPRLVVFEAQFGDSVPRDLAIETTFVPLDLANADPLAALAGGEAIIEAFDAEEEDVATILYTSGTTGKPKGALLTHFNIIHSVKHFQVTMRMTADDRSIIAVPMSHVTGLVALVHVTVASASTLLIMPAFKAADFIALAEREAMTHTIIVPAMFNLCLLQPDLDAARLPAWRISGYGGAIMPAATIEAIEKRLPGLQLVNAYGATETTSPATIMPPIHAVTRRDTVGLPAPCADIRIMDEHGRELPPGEPGEIWIAGPMVVKGYWENEAATAREFVGGYWKSGDLGAKDAEGFVKVVDRIKDLINRGGYKIYAAEIEGILIQHPAVLEAAVVPTPCPVLGERVAAIVVLKEDAADLAAADLVALLKDKVADYKTPEQWRISRTPLARNSNGKVLKRLLRAQFESVG